MKVKYYLRAGVSRGLQTVFKKTVDYPANKLPNGKPDHWFRVYTKPKWEL